ncbi:hypothetical protein MSAN_01996700 [Mycena sanguinolenta]|uniref:SAM domain-containing protein n=1 Tax=Mycena sanguinolenta TaxID=230812 RepID=A0A8H6XJN3_9AGAR|nr:hypothetical protein MSAN_01996700 [Mycena sanguinolenta]
MNLSMTTVTGGTGGRGGRGGRKGGPGGVGERPQVAREDTILFTAIVGGTGGEAGEGGDEGGAGGAGQGPIISTDPLLPGVNLVTVPDMGIDEFCSKYGVRDTTRKQLKELGFAKAADILEMTSADLNEAGFNVGEIAELKRTLRKICGIIHKSPLGPFGNNPAM